MLHNSGPYGPNETPINMGAPINMTQMNSPVNIGHNLSNLGKIPQPPAQGSTTSYNIPDYSTYGHPALNMTSQINPFPNYNPAVYQPNYLMQNPASVHDTSWQNGALPMNLNVQANHASNIVNRPLPYDKSASNHLAISDFKEPTYRKNMPINIPQVPPKSFQNDRNRYELYNANQDKFNHFNHHLNLSKTQDRPLLDNTRRKSLENTVRLIEDILINTTKNKDLQRQQELMTSKTMEKSSLFSKDKQKSLTTEKPLFLKPESPKPIVELEEKCKDVINQDEVNHDDSDNQSLKDESAVEENVTIMNEESHTQSEESDSAEDLSEDKSANTEEPQKINNVVIKSEIESEPEIIVKIEQMGWTDTDYVSPFQRDTSGVVRDELDDSEIIDCQTSVNEATALIKNGESSKGYFECPHCNLIVKHPKRFLIHTKWHSFGLTNDKRMETALQKEMERNQRKEARVIDRMNSNEVTENVDGKKIYSCKDCSKAFSSKGSLKNHRQRYHPTRMRECKICGKSVLGWMAHRAHLASHNNEAGFQCIDCPKKFKYAHSLAKHRDTHLEKTLGCDQCDKKFGSAAQLKMHQKVHERAQRGTTFRCSYCAKGFYEAYNLAVHERTHRNERPFQCDICNTSFGTNSSLKRHLKVSHSTSKPYECSTCHRSFVSEGIRDRHELRQHGNPEDFKFPCKQCECRYMKLKDLQKHVYKAHPKGRRKKKEQSDSE